MKNAARLISVMAALAVVISACSPSSRLEPCKSDEDCPDFHACSNSLCVQVQCKKDPDCNAQKYCRNYQCVDRVSCTQDTDCLDDEICENGFCTQVGCKQDSDCTEGYSCVEHECVSAACSSDDDCDPGMICIEGMCTTGCNSQRDCPAGTLCATDSGEHGLCVECIEDSDCSAGQKCVEYSCREFCTNDQDCSEGFCDTQSHLCVDCTRDDQCEIGFICEQQTCEQGCRKDRDCPTGQICESDSCRTGCRQDDDCSTGHICLSDTCQEGCRIDQDCQPGQICQDNSCVDFCSQDADCVQGQICDSGSCRDGCRIDDDCFDAVCNQTTHTCVECRVKDDCELGNLCIDGYCKQGCEVDRDCPMDLHCAPELGPHGTCTECDADQDCQDPDKPRCLEHQCAPECFVDDDCTNDELCVDGHCQAPVQECDLRISPEGTLDFGSVNIGHPAQMTVTLSNVGLSNCNISQLELQENPLWPSHMEMLSQPALPLVLQPLGQGGSEYEVVLEFSPTEEKTTGALLWITSDDPDLLIGDDESYCSWPSPPTIGQACIVVQGEGSRQELASIPPKVDLGKVRTGCNALTSIITLYNVGSDVAIDSVSLENSDNAFQLTGLPSLPVELLSDGEMEVRIRFDPQVSGIFTNTLLVSYGTTSLQVPISGQAINHASVIDEFQIHNRTPVDVLLVIDNSGTMNGIQSMLTDNIEEFLTSEVEAGYDYHIGVIATEINEAEEDLGDPPRDIIPGVLVQAPNRPSFITPSTPDHINALKENMNIGTCCSDEQEAGLHASYMGLSEPILSSENSGFLRKEARLSIVYISDEDDQSPASSSFYAEYFSSLKSNNDLVNLHAACGDVPNGCSNQGYIAEPGARYVAVQEQTGGLFQSICSWEPDTMSNMSQAVFKPIQSFTLSGYPLESSIVVYEDNLFVPEASCNRCENGWTYQPEDNSIFLGDDYIPMPNSTLQVSYTAICQ